MRADFTRSQSFDRSVIVWVGIVDVDGFDALTLASGLLSLAIDDVALGSRDLRRCRDAADPR